MDFNAVRHNALVPRDHVESYFLKANDPAGDRAFWLKATIFSRAKEPGNAVAEAWAVAFDRRGGERRHIGLKRTVPFHRATFARSGLNIRWDEKAEGARFELRPGVTSGALDQGKTHLAWDLRFSGDDSPLELLPFAWMYRAAFPKSKPVSPFPDVLFQGSFEVGSERWDLHDWHGMVGHNWGRGHADLYAWCHVNAWNEGAEPLVVEAVSGRVRAGPVLLPLLTLVAVRFRGVDYRFHMPRDMVKARARIEGRRYSFAVENDLGRISAEVQSDANDTVGLYYANPVGPMTHCLNSKLAQIHVTFEPKGRAKVDRVSNMAALEIGTHEADPDVRMLA